ncbi:MAG: hypothetical protein JXQ29_02445 [Planctomycetes bacterium]|nr:hypothetical protein [Planctomycetota bacterium]
MRYPTILMITVISIAPGCFFSRTKVEAPVAAEAIEKIEIGRSTTADVARLLGAPTDIIFSNREHDPLRVFAYEYTHTVTKTTGLTLVVITFLNADTKRDHLLVFFDDRGVVSAIGESLRAGDARYKFPFGD